MLSPRFFYPNSLPTHSNHLAPPPVPCSHRGSEHSPGLCRKQLRLRERSQEPKPTQNQEHKREFMEGLIRTSCPVAVGPGTVDTWKAG